MVYDVIIIGAGPAGLSAGLYAGRAKLATLIIEREKDGGQIVQTAEIENYPGGVIGDTGYSLIERMVEQAKAFGVEKAYDTVSELKLDEEIKTVICKNESYQAKTVILAMGTKPIKIGCEGEEEFTGKGVSYCATCDGAFFTGLRTFVVGGGDSAVEEAIFLTRFAREVTVIHRRDELRAAKFIQEKAFANPKINFLWDSVVKELKGNGVLNTVVVENVKTKEITEIVADEADGLFGLFVFIGLRPQTELVEGKVTLNKGYIVTDENMKTSIDGVFAAGDAREKLLRQVVTATADGAIAAVQAEIHQA